MASQHSARHFAYALFVGIFSIIFLSSAVFTIAEAAAPNHGLPMTNVPFRYSSYFFMLAIIVSNLYAMRRNREKEMH